MQKEVKQKTVSLWSYINSDQDVYKNPLYWAQQHALEPVASLRYIKMWKGLYCRWNPSMRPQVVLINNNVISIIIVIGFCNIFRNQFIKEQENFYI